MGETGRESLSELGELLAGFLFLAVSIKGGESQLIAAMESISTTEKRPDYGSAKKGE